MHKTLLPLTLNTETKKTYFYISPIKNCENPVYAECMKKVILLPLISLLITVATPAYADEATLEGFATFSYSSVVKLKKTGCQVIPIKYVTNEDLPRENTVFLVAITPKTNKTAYGYEAWFSTQTYMGDDAPPTMSRVGVLNLKVCRKPWLYSSKATKKTPAIVPGTYRLFFDGGYRDPITGEVLGEKTEVIKTIKFN